MAHPEDDTGQRRPESGRADRAVGRRLAHRQEAAEAEVDRILRAALVVMARAYPASARVADVVAAAGTSNQTFYKYFPSKAELTLAVLERGIERVADYLEHQMAKTDDPREQVGRWIEGVLAQVADERAARGSLAALAELDRHSTDPAVDGRQAIVHPLRDLLVDPLTRAGYPDVDRTAYAIYETTFGTMRRHLFSASRPTPDDVENLVRFCLAGADR